jgi:hypothetical protein
MAKIADIKAVHNGARFVTWTYTSTLMMHRMM